jgi:hypothetical protein
MRACAHIINPQAEGTATVSVEGGRAGRQAGDLRVVQTGHATPLRWQAPRRDGTFEVPAHGGGGAQWL